MTELNWWGKQPTTNKVLIVIGAIALIGTVVYFSTRKKKDSTAKTETDESGEWKAPDEVSDETVTDTTTPKPSDLPNGGVGCSSIKTMFDLDFDYIKCGGIWYTKSKSNPKSPYAKGLYKNWLSLSTNKVATDRLNRRYPTD
jgi:LPXTG-motif cell wall-anchored protein